MRKSTIVIACSGLLFAGLLAIFISLRPTIIEAGKGGMAGSSCKADIAPPGGDGQVNVDDLVALSHSVWRSA